MYRLLSIFIAILVAFCDADDCAQAQAMNQLATALTTSHSQPPHDPTPCAHAHTAFIEVDDELNSISCGSESGVFAGKSIAADVNAIFASEITRMMIQHQGISAQPDHLSASYGFFLDWAINSSRISMPPPV
jgi:hypothetical protein